MKFPILNDIHPTTFFTTPCDLNKLDYKQLHTKYLTECNPQRL